MSSPKRPDESPTAFTIRLMKEQGAREALAALRERCAEKVPLLREMATAHDEPARLRGKAEGLTLTISYLDEYVRVEGLAAEPANLDPDLPRAPIAEGPGS